MFSSRRRPRKSPMASHWSTNPERRSRKSLYKLRRSTGTSLTSLTARESRRSVSRKSYGRRPNGSKHAEECGKGRGNDGGQLQSAGLRSRHSAQKSFRRSRPLRRTPCARECCERRRRKRRAQGRCRAGARRLGGVLNICSAGPNLRPGIGPTVDR